MQFESLEKRIKIIHTSIDHLKDQYIKDLESLKIRFKPNAGTII